MKEREEDLKTKQMSQKKQINPYIFAGLPERIQNIVAVDDNEKGTEDLRAIAKVVSDVTNISIQAMRGKSRVSEIVEARQLFMYFAYHVRQDVVKVAEYVGKHHSSTSHAIKTVLSRREGFGERKFKDKFDLIDSRVSISTINSKLGVQWKNTNYLVYPDGRVCNERLGTTLKPYVHQLSKQLWVSLFLNGKGKKYLVKRMVAECFIENPLERTVVINLNGDNHDNRLENLKWGTKKEQQQHITKHQLRTTKFDTEQILNIRAMAEKGMKQSAIAKVMQTSPSMVSYIVKRKIYNFV